MGGLMYEDKLLAALAPLGARSVRIELLAISISVTMVKNDYTSQEVCMPFAEGWDDEVVKAFTIWDRAKKAKHEVLAEFRATWRDRAKAEGRTDAEIDAQLEALGLPA